MFAPAWSSTFVVQSSRAVADNSLERGMRTPYRCTSAHSAKASVRDGLDARQEKLATESHPAKSQVTPEPSNHLRQPLLPLSTPRHSVVCSRLLAAPSSSRLRRSLSPGRVSGRVSNRSFRSSEPSRLGFQSNSFNTDIESNSSCEHAPDTYINGTSSSSI